MPDVCSFAIGYLRILPGRLVRLLLLFSVHAAPIAATGAADFPVAQIADGVYLHQGQTVPFGHPRQDDIANLSFVVGERCVAVIDTGGSLEIGRAMRNAVESVTDLPVCYVINTHVHPDHTLGNAAFSEDQPNFVGHHKLPHAFGHNHEFFLENYGHALEGRDASQVLIPPDTVVADRLDLDLGGRTLELRALPTGHTEQDLLVFDPLTRTLWLGSLFVERIPAIDGSLTGWIETLRELQSVEAIQVVPGNGPAPAPWPDAADAQIRYLETLARETRALIDRGGFIEEAVESVGQSERDNWLLFDQHHSTNVIRAYTELEWE